MRLVMILIIFSSRDEKGNAAREKSEVCFNQPGKLAATLYKLHRFSASNNA